MKTLDSASLCLKYTKTEMGVKVTISTAKMAVLVHLQDNNHYQEVTILIASRQ